MSDSKDPKLPTQLEWLADAPLFIDGDQVFRFYDAVARPAGEVVRTVDTLTDEKKSKIATKLNADIAVEPGALASLLSPVFSFLKPSVSVGGELAGDYEARSAKGRTTEVANIKTPQRRLIDLVVHYLVEQTDRLFFVDNLADTDWQDPDTILQTPRALAFLDLPASVKLIPTAAEFENGEIELIYNELDFGEDMPAYPEKGDNLLDLRKKYWQWFEQNYSATKAMTAVENAVTKNQENPRGRLRWIDYRLPIDSAGTTLHLHLSPRGEFDTGVFAYNFIKRGFKHGLRLVGTTKSEPDMNVLAVYEK